MEKVYRIGTRNSPLALRQVEEILANLRRVYPDFKARIVGIETYGDRNRATPISQIEGTDFFTREIDMALIEGEVDFAIHSAKDLPEIIDDRLSIAGITESKDKDDVLVSRFNLSLDELPYRAKIGTSSLRRKQGLKNYRKDFQIIDIRGNIEERLEKLDKQEFDAIVIAAIGLIRLKLRHRITQRIPYSIIKPHPLQGRLAIVTRRKDEDTIRMCRKCLSQSNGGKYF